MRLLTATDELCGAMRTAFEESTAIHAATAWASVNFEGFELIKKHRRKLRRFLVGIHFNQTHPSFIEEFQTEESVRFIMSSDGTFHPKVYFFEMPGGGWQCLVGSPNFTRAAFESNAELAVLMESSDTGSQDVRTRFFDVLDGWWPQGKHLSADELVEYKEQWRRTQAALPRRPTVFGKPTASGIKPDGGADVHDIPICTMEWDKFFALARKERDSSGAPTMRQRLKVLSEIRTLFAKTLRFGDMEKNSRYEIAGLVTYKELDFKWFGSMSGAGRFKGAINRNDPHVSSALDLIALDGPVERADYLAFVSEFEKAFPDGGGGVATATRLLAVKRPDIFVCLDSRNRRRLCEAFKIRQAVSYESYWDSIVERIRESMWWQSGRPSDHTQVEIWDARAAMMDALFYER